MEKISPLELRHLLIGEEELALIDVREQGTYSESHLLFAVCVPLSRLELLIGDLVPRNDTRLVITFYRYESGPEKFKVVFGRKSLAAELLNQMDHRQRKVILEKEAAFETP